jgi:hypothetical protein
MERALVSINCGKCGAVLVDVQSHTYMDGANRVTEVCGICACGEKFDGFTLEPVKAVTQG